MVLDLPDNKPIKLKEFEDLTIREIREMIQQFLLDNPNFKTAQELLDDLSKDKN